MTSMTERRQKAKRRAAKAGLDYVNTFEQGISRRRCGRGFSYLSPAGRTIKSKRQRARIEQLAIPPAWTDVWICPTSSGHIQAKGQDAAGRSQYIYHEHWDTISSMTKFDRMARFAQVLPKIRRRIRKDLSLENLPRERVMAAIVRLLDKACLRVGNDQSVKAKGATTLESEHVSLEGFRVSLEFPSKSGQKRDIEFSDKKVAKVIEQCEEIDGQYLFTYQQGNSSSRVTSSDVNLYLQQIADESVTAKDFRTWWGSVKALGALRSSGCFKTASQRKAACRSAVKAASAALGNTIAVCRKSYIHPGLLAAAESGELADLLTGISTNSIAELGQDEVAFIELLPRLDFT